MHGYNFTNQVRAALANARREAARLGHEYVGPEHELLGLLDEESSLAVAVIESFGVATPRLETRILELVKRGPARTERGDLPYTSLAKKVLEYAMAEARELDHSYVGTEHLLLGLVRQTKGLPSSVLGELGITLEPARERVVELLHAGKRDDLVFLRSTERSAARARARRQRTPEQIAAFSSLAASMIETLAHDREIAAVFATQGVDVAALIAALRSIQAPPA